MQIPIENIYYLLCYAWNKLEEKDRVNVVVEDNMELLDLFAKVLIGATKLLLKRGIEKDYIEYSEDIYGIKGKIQISQTLKSNLLLRSKANCTFDEFSSDILVNRILLSTINRLTRTKNVDKNLKYELVSLQRMFPEIQLIELNSSLFNKVKYNRNNRFYGFVINVCQIIFDCTLPTEEKGTFKFSDFTKDDNKMAMLFEAFVRNFYKLEQRKFGVVKKETIKWQFESIDKNDRQYIPQMETDITLENESEKIIIDTKFYRETLNVNYGSDKIKSVNLYQLFSYLLNQENGEEKTQYATGILLYPTIDDEYNLDYRYKNHPMKIKTVNLNANWRSISERLLSIVAV